MPQERRVRALSIDMTGAEDRRPGGRGLHVPEGDYVMKVKDAYVTKVQKGKNEGKDQVVWELTVEKPENRRGPDVLYHRTGVWPEQIYSFRNICEDIRGGKPLPKRAADIDLQKLFVGQLVGATLRDGEPYNDKIKSEIAGTFPAEKYEDTGTTDDDDDVESEDDEDEIESVEDVDEDDI